MARIAKHNKLKKLRICPIFEKQKEELNKLIAELVNAPDAQLKVKWSWGIVQNSNVLLKCPFFKKKKVNCKLCRVFAESHKKLADLVILGGRM